MDLYHQMTELEGKLAEDARRRVERTIHLFKRHALNFERKLRLVQDFVSRSANPSPTNLRLLEQEIKSVATYERREIKDEKREEQTLLMALAALHEVLLREHQRKARSSPQTEQDIQFRRTVVISLNDLFRILQEQIAWFEKFQQTGDGDRAEIINLIKKEWKILYDVEAPNLEGLRKGILEVLHSIQTSANPTNAESCQKKDFFIGGIAGTVYVTDFNHIPQSGVVIAPGFHSSRTQYDLFCRALADAGLLAYVIDLPKQGSEGDYTVGNISEYILYAVKIIRGYFRIEKVGLISHSSGSIPALLSLAGYNPEVEKRLFSYRNQYIMWLLMAFQKGNTPQNLYYIMNMLDYFYKLIKQTVMEAAAEAISHNANGMYSARIDAFVGMSVPRQFQDLLSPALAHKFQGMLSGPRRQKLLRWLLNKVQNEKAEEASATTPGIAKYKLDREFEGVQLIFLKLTYGEARDFFSYIISVENPPDFMELLNFFSGKPEFQAIKAGYAAVPKFIMLGAEDPVLHTSTRGQKKILILLNYAFNRKALKDATSELFDFYQTLGAEYRKYPGMTHVFVQDGQLVNDVSQCITHPIAIGDAVSFLKRYLPGLHMPGGAQRESNAYRQDLRVA